MSIATGVAFAAARAGLIGAAAVMIAPRVAALLVRATVERPRLRRLAWVMLVTTFLTPAVLTGYGYSHLSLWLVRYPALSEALYCGLVLMRYAPVAALVYYFAPPPVSPEAIHCRDLLRARRGGPAGFLSDAAFTLRLSAPTAAAAFGAVFLFAFGEFEMASLMKIPDRAIPTWTVCLLLEHARALSLSHSLLMALAPALVEASALVLAAVLLVRSGPRSRQGRTGLTRSSMSRASLIAASAWLAASVAATTVVPLVGVSGGAVEGAGALLGSFRLGKDLVASVFFAAGAGALAYLAGARLSRWTLAGGRRVRRIFPAVALSLPGLMGGLVLGLVVLALFQLPGLRALRDTPVPLLVALTALLLPFAFILHLVLRAFRPAEALHLAWLTGAGDPERERRSRELARELHTRKRFWIVCFVFLLGYLELTASAILAPSNMTPVLVTLYNLMHYGRGAMLSAMLLAAFALPGAILLVVWTARGALASTTTLLLCHRGHRGHREPQP